MSIRTAEELEKLRGIGKIVRLSLDKMTASARSGITTAELYEIGVHERRRLVRRKSKAGTSIPLNLDVRPLTPDLWPALEDLFGPRGACNGCWCMYWRIGAEYRKRNRDENKKAFRAIVNAGPPPGLIAFEGDLPIGWCQITPRNAVPHLDKVRRLRRVDELPVWSISCFYIRIGYRKRGVTTALIEAAVELARAARAPAIEAYPLDADLTPSSSSTGYVSNLLRAGFQEVARYEPPRPILRKIL